MPVGTRANPQPEAPMANLQQTELPVTAIQKAYDRMIDAPTICADSDAVTTAAINAININSICVNAAWIKLSSFKNIANINSDAIFKEH
eukprot:111417-Prorocentrum_minimum.AAC.1